MSSDKKYPNLDCARSCGCSLVDDEKSELYSASFENQERSNNNIDGIGIVQLDRKFKSTEMNSFVTFFAVVASIATAVTVVRCDWNDHYAYPPAYGYQSGAYYPPPAQPGYYAGPPPAYQQHASSYYPVKGHGSSHSSLTSKLAPKVMGAVAEMLLKPKHHDDHHDHHDHHSGTDVVNLLSHGLKKLL